MDKYICPSCGKPYNGKRCASCLYEPFGDAAQGEPSARTSWTHFDGSGGYSREYRSAQAERYSAANQKKMSRYQRSEWQEREKRRQKPLPKWALFLLCAYIAFHRVSPVSLYELMSDGLSSEPLPSMPEFNAVAALPDPVFPFADGVVVYDSDGIVVTAEWSGGAIESGDIPILIENTSGQSVMVSTDKVVVNGYGVEAWQYSCLVSTGAMEQSYLRLDWEELAQLGIDAVTELAFCVEISDSADELIAVGDVVTLRAAEASAPAMPEDEQGVLVWDEAGVRIFCLGLKGTDCQDASIEFVMENTTDRYIQIYSTECCVNGQPAELYLCSQVLPGTKILAHMYLNAALDIGIEDVREIQTLEYSFGMFDIDTGERIAQTPAMALEPAE